MYPYPFSDYTTAYRFPVSQEIIRDIEESIQDERHDSIYYEKVSEMTKSPEEKRIFLDISRDEKEHIRLFKQMYRQITGRDYNPPQVPVNVPQRYLMAIEQAILGEAGAVKSYNKIYAALADMNYRAVLTKIIHDELRHLGELNYLYTKNSIRETSVPMQPRDTELDFSSYKGFTRNSYFRNEKEKEITIGELPKYDGKEGKPAYIAVDGIVYDVSNEKTWDLDINWELPGGSDLTIEFQSNKEMSKVLGLLEKVGIIKNEFTKEELANFDGSNEKPAYIAVDGIVYDVSKEKTWDLDINLDLPGGRDLTIEFKSNKEMKKLLGLLTQVGFIKE